MKPSLLVSFLSRIHARMSFRKCPQILVLEKKCALDFVLEKMSPRENALEENVP
jgi:hypothetical protein